MKNKLIYILLIPNSAFATTYYKVETGILTQIFSYAILVFLFASMFVIFSASIKKYGESQKGTLRSVGKGSVKTKVSGKLN